MKEKVILFFNKVSKQFGGMLKPNQNGEELKLSDEYFIYKEVELDTTTETWEGNYDEGKIIPIKSFEDKPIVSEYMLDGQCGQKIERQYPLHRQLNILSNLMDKLVQSLEKIDPEAVENEEVEKFKDMIEYIKHTKENNKRWKKSYANSDSHIYTSAKEIEEYINNELDGGVRNVVGRPLRKPNSPWRRDY